MRMHPVSLGYISVLADIEIIDKSVCMATCLVAAPGYYYPRQYIYILAISECPLWGPSQILFMRVIAIRHLLLVDRLSV